MLGGSPHKLLPSDPFTSFLLDHGLNFDLAISKLCFIYEINCNIHGLYSDISLNSDKKDLCKRLPRDTGSDLAHGYNLI